MPQTLDPKLIVDTFELDKWFKQLRKKGITKSLVAESIGRDNHFFKYVLSCGYIHAAAYRLLCRTWDVPDSIWTGKYLGKDGKAVGKDTFDKLIAENPGSYLFRDASYWANNAERLSCLMERCAE